MCEYKYRLKGVIIILIDGQKINIKWSRGNKLWYTEKGYSFSSYDCELIVNAEDLQPTSKEKVFCICDVCGIVKSIGFYTFSRSYKKYSKYVCHACANQLKWNESLESRQSDYYSRLSTKCMEYGYTLTSNKDEIKNNDSYITYICPKHGEKSMKIANFLSGKKCPDCAIENSHDRYKHSVDEVIRRVKDCGGYIINPEEYHNQDKHNLRFVCPECGNEFISSLKHFQQHGGQVCKDCANYESLGEKKVRYFLENNNIDYIPQKWFPDCRDVYPLPFDFYLTDMNTIIEFDGQQHFIQSNLFPETLELIQKHDMIKNNYCASNSINLIRIPYTDINKVNDILGNKLNIHTKI